MKTQNFEVQRVIARVPLASLIDLLTTLRRPFKFLVNVFTPLLSGKGSPLNSKVWSMGLFLLKGGKTTNWLEAFPYFLT